ncbi:MAG: malonyl-CoA decarboxylase family protein [Granulosicoccus sp.]
MSILADLLSTVFERHAPLIAFKRQTGKSIETLAEELLGAVGDMQILSLGTEIIETYQTIDDERKKAFFEYLGHTMGIDADAIRASLHAYEKDPTRASYSVFLNSVEPKRQDLIRRLNRVPQATAGLVKMRADLLRLSGEQPDLASLDLDFKHLFESWFNRGFLVLRPINWESPAHILEKVIAYEAVHEITSWDDLRRRLQPSDRRCFAFFHPAMPDEPLIFVEVALTRGPVQSVQALLSESRVPISAADADTAIFYSISNCQSGLARISFGNFLIKQVASDLSAELQGLKTFVTLSPMPLLKDWADNNGLTNHFERTESLRNLAACYLLNVRREDGWPYDPVARFHLGNGAGIKEVYTGADMSKKGMAQSGGVMVSYHYDLAKTTANLENYAASQIVSASPGITSAAAAFKLPDSSMG